MSKLDTSQKLQTATTLTNEPSGILQRKCASCGNHTIAGGKCEDCKDKHNVLQRKSSNNSQHLEVPPIVHEVLNSSGQPLDKTTRAFFEPRFAHNFSRVPVSTASSQLSNSSLTIGEPADIYEQEADCIADSIMLKEKTENKTLSTNEQQNEKFDLSQVRVHTDARAAESARAVNALAYTVGHNIVFGAGRFAPALHEGRRLIAHELTHVVQQSGEQIQTMLHRKEENNAPLAAIKDLPMRELLTRLSELPENILDDEEAGGLVGGSKVVLAMRAVRAKMEKGLVDFLVNNKRAFEALPPDQASEILGFLAAPEEGKSQKAINTDLEIDITIVEPSNVRLLGEGRTFSGDQSSPDVTGDQSSPDEISEFEEGLLKNRNIISGVVIDPETREIIGYRTLHADGLSTLVDREGKFIVDAGIPLGVESEGIGPLEYAPSPKALLTGAFKAGAGVAGKLLVKGALKKGVASGGKVTLGAIVKMRKVALAIAKKALSPRAEADAFIKAVKSGVKVIRTLSVEAAEELVKGKLGRFMAVDLNKQGTIGPFGAFQIITRGHGGAYQAHHIIESSVLKHFGFDTIRAPSVILRAGEHTPISTLLAGIIPKDQLEHLTKKEALKAYEIAYKNFPTWIAEVRRYFK